MHQKCVCLPKVSATTVIFFKYTKFPNKILNKNVIAKNNNYEKKKHLSIFIYI